MKSVSIKHYLFCEAEPDRKLEAIESMVKSERDNCLGYPLVLRFLNYKVNSK